ncbi:MAG: hypothetical protein WD267_05610 [Balneolales bacterium]
MKQTGLLVIWFIACMFCMSLLNSCTDNITSDNGSGDADTTIERESISGVVQKGPFNSGSNITLFELKKNNLSQSGRSFITQINNNLGHFELNNIKLASPYASFRADGFYFNEVLGKQSNSQITLHAIADVSGENAVNINVLSHLEKPR